MAQTVKCLPTTRETQVQSLGQEDPLEKEMATHSSTLAWKIPSMEECGRLQSMVSQSQTWLKEFTHSREICFQVKKQQLKPDMEQQTGSKLGKEYVKAVYYILLI